MPASDRPRYHGARQVNPYEDHGDGMEGTGQELESLLRGTHGEEPGALRMSMCFAATFSMPLLPLAVPCSMSASAWSLSSGCGNGAGCVERG